jgi:hypothetical protein
MNQSITKVWSQHLPQSAESSPKHTSLADSNATPLTSNSSSQDRKERFKNQRKSNIKVFRTDPKNLKSRQLIITIHKN